MLSLVHSQDTRQTIERAESKTKLARAGHHRLRQRVKSDPTLLGRFLERYRLKGRKYYNEIMKNEFLGAEAVLMRTQELQRANRRKRKIARNPNNYVHGSRCGTLPINKADAVRKSRDQKPSLKRCSVSRFGSFCATIANYGGLR